MAVLQKRSWVFLGIILVGFLLIILRFTSLYTKRQEHLAQRYHLLCEVLKPGMSKDEVLKLLDTAGDYVALGTEEPGPLIELHIAFTDPIGKDVYGAFELGFIDYQYYEAYIRGLSRTEVICDFNDQFSNLETNERLPITESPSPTYVVVEMLSIGDGGLISGQPCESPCFFGIRLGETHFDQVIRTLEINGIAPCTQINETNIFCSAGNIANVSVAINGKTLIVSGVGYNPSIPITVGDIVEKYGVPNFVYVDRGSNPEFTTLSMHLIWDEIKMDADLGEIPDVGDQIYFVENITEVQWINFSEVNYLEPLQSWKGYGNYKP